MKKVNLLYLSISILVVITQACSNNSQNQEETKSEAKDYSGIYKANGGTGCALTITLTKDGAGYKYNISGEHYDADGIAIIEETDATYISFDGPIGSNEPKSVSGQIKDNVILIQNYGNSMNEYHFFVECDEKFLEFKK